MEIEPVTGIAAVTALTPEYIHRAYEAKSPSQVALVEAQAVAVETTEQLAIDGDPRAIDELAHEHRNQTPFDAQRLQPSHVNHPVGAHEPGKGERIDIYD